MSLKRNLVWNYLGQAYAAGVGLVMLPVYVRYLGAESYGLVGFFAMLQAWGQVLDMGLTPTLSRELSRARAGVVDHDAVATMVRATEWFFAVLGFAAGLAVVAAAGWIARDWLKPAELSLVEMQHALMLMGAVMALRWLVALYRGGLVGLERMGEMNAIGSVFATIRSIGVLAVFLLWTRRPTGFFAYQVAVAALELIGTQALFYRAFSMRRAGWLPRFHALRSLFGVAGSMTFLTILWIMISQTDKLVLSGTVELNRFGFYTVAVAVAAGITMLATPLGQALQPRFTILVAQHEEESVTRLYRGSTQGLAAVAFAVSGMMACFSEPLLRAWTGSAEAAREAGRVLPMYAVGNAVAAVLTVAFLLQFAHGKLRWHVIGNILFAVVWFPGAIWAARNAGPVGVGWMWLGTNVAYLLFWIPWIHRWLIPGLWWRWLLYDVLAIFAVEATLLLAARHVLTLNLGRFGTLASLGLIAAIVGLAGLLIGRDTRTVLARWRGTLLATRTAG